MQEQFKNMDQVFRDKLSAAKDHAGIHDAWHKMEAMLDAQDAPKRKPFGAWWSLSVLLVAITAGVIWGVQYIDKNDTFKQNGTPLATSDKVVSEAMSLPSTAPDVYTETNANLDHNASSATTINTQPNNIVYNKENTATIHKQNSITNNAVMARPARVVDMVHTAKANSLTDAPLQRVAITDEGMVTHINTDAKSIKRQNTTEALDAKTMAATKKALIDLSNNGALLADKNNQIVKQHKNNVQNITIYEKPVIENNHVVAYKEDTISIIKSQKVNYTPLSRHEIIALKSMNTLMVQQADAEHFKKLIVAEAKPLNKILSTSLTENAVTNAGKSLGKSNAASGTLTQKLDINRFVLANKNWTGSILLGGSMNLPYQPIGAHAGFTFNYRLSDLWSVGSGINYLLRRSNNTIQDQAITNTLISSEATPLGYLHTISRMTNTQSYQLNNVHFIDIPFNVTLHREKMDYWVGAHISYALPQAMKTSTNSVTEQVQILDNNETYTGLNQSYTASSPQDFSAKIGVGYHIGAAYYIHDKWSIYTRLAHNIWDNSTTPMGKQVSSSFLKLPTISLGMQFHINKSKKVKLLLDEDKR